MNNDPEEDLRSARAERKKHARERQRDEERLRERERQRAEASARDREANREKDRQRREESESRRRTYEARYGIGADEVQSRPQTDFGREFHRVAYALVRSNTRLLVGVTEVVGNLITNLNDSVWGRPMGGPRIGVDAPYDEPLRSRRDEPYFDDDEPLRARRYEERGRYRTRNRVESFVTQSSDIISNLSGDLTQAVRDSAAILSRSAEDLSRILEDVAERERYGYDEPEPAEEVAEEALDEAEARDEDRYAPPDA
jgi:hypothetical protein